MIIHQSIQWRGASGKEYTYYIWPRHSHVENGPPGNFIHVKEGPDGTLLPVYIGQTDDLNHRFVKPETQSCVDANGATQLHLHSSVSQGQEERLAEVADLVARWKPACNAD